MSDDLVFGIGGDNTELKRSTTEAEQIINRWVAEAEAKIEGAGGSIPVEVIGVEASKAALAEVAKGFEEINPNIDISKVESLKASIAEAGAELSRGAISADDFDKKILSLTSDTTALAAAISQVASNAKDIESAIDPYAVTMDEINAKTDSHVEGAAEVVKELQEVHDAARNVSDELGKSSVNMSDVVSAGKRAFAAASALAASIQQTNKFITERAEKYYEIQALKEKEIEQERDLAKIAEDRLKKQKDQATTEVESGSEGSPTLDTLKEELKAAQNNSDALLKIRSKLKAQFEEEQRKRKEAIDAGASSVEFGGQNLGKNFGESIEALRDATFGSGLTEAKERFDKANASLEESNAKFKKIQEAIKEVEAAGEAKAAKDKKASDEQAAEAQKRIELLKLEAELISKTGSEREAIQQKIDRLNSSESNTPEQTDAEVAAQAKVRGAKAAADAEKEASNKRKQDQKDAERFESRLARQKERASDSEARTAQRRGRLETRQQRERERANRPIGGVDSSLQSAISRIQAASNAPNPLNELAEKHQAENRTFEAAAARERAKQTAILERMEKKRPTESPAVL